MKKKTATEAVCAKCELNTILNTPLYTHTIAEIKIRWLTKSLGILALIYIRMNNTLRKQNGTEQNIILIVLNCDKKRFRSNKYTISAILCRHCLPLWRTQIHPVYDTRHNLKHKTHIHKHTALVSIYIQQRNGFAFGKFTLQRKFIHP